MYTPIALFVDRKSSHRVERRCDWLMVTAIPVNRQSCLISAINLMCTDHLLLPARLVQQPISHSRHSDLCKRNGNHVC